ncbi:MAG: adenylate/guanylate cyclase domain-containing protein [Chlamydiales bacterium]|nr:adenylate/guanylate cyclase domain-containing protein [Chlamydiales bacterium]
MKRLFQSFIVRTLRVEILTIFLVLLSFSSAIIIGFTYFKDSQAFDKTFHLSMHRLNSVVADRTNCLLSEYRRIPEFIRGYVQQQPQLTVHSKELLDYFLNLMNQQKELTAVFMGMPNGDALAVHNVSTTEHPTLFSRDEPTPEGTVFVCLLVDHSKPLGEQEMWLYLSKDFKTLAAHSRPVTYDLFSRPWYQGAVKTGQLFWTDLYRYDFAKEKGFSCAVPIYDSSGKLLSVVGTDVPLYVLSRLLSAQKIGHLGKAYVCDANGEIVVPPPENSDEQQLVSEAFSHLQPGSNEAEFYVDFQDEKYLVSIHGFPLSSTKNWNIILLDPRNDLFQEILDARKEIIAISFVILIFSTVCVIYFSKRISRPIVSLSQEVDRITHLDLESQLRVHSMIKEVQMMDSSIAAMRAALRSFSRYVPKEIVLELIHKGQEIALGGEKKEITIFFSDIEDFTTVSEALSVDQLTVLLEEYFEVLSQTILRYRGTIDKYIGDGVMAFWGAPHVETKQADEACLAALYCQYHLKVLNEKRVEHHLPVFATRIGINTGVVFVGNIGTSERMNYTAIGDSVNLASRLQNVNKIYRTKILIAEKTKMQLSDHFLLRPLGIVEVKGKKNKTKIYELMGSTSDPLICPTAEQIELAALFTAAYNAFEQGDLEGAKQQFLAIHAKFPQDEPTMLYIR